jgi:hypothetical protein
MSTDPEDDELQTAYARGDFARIRKLAADPSASERARAWSQRVSVDVVVYVMLAFAFTLFCAIVARYALP